MTASKFDVRIAGDVGGTFTDLVMLREGSNQVFVAKTKSTPQDLSNGFITGIERLLEISGATHADVANIIFTSTAATNAVLELSGARIGLLVTKGFRHILEIARANIPGRLTNELTYDRPERLVPLERVREVDERILADGSVRLPLDEESARHTIRDLLQQDVESIAISLIHSYVNADHERRLREIIVEQAPNIPVSLSSEVVPVYREYERTLTTALNAYVAPVIERAVRRLGARLGDAGISAKLEVVRCDGGLMGPEAAIHSPVHTVLSGPAAGVYGAAYTARLAGYENIVSLDMGGTSTDVSLASGGRAPIRADAMIGEYPVKIPIMDIVTIGAGGGSIASISSTGALRVGPRSAGATPGPVCYGLGGTEITVTDANLILGRLSPNLAGGEVVVDEDRCHRAMEALGKRIGMDRFDLAEGILKIVNEKMLGALRVVSIQRGFDPRDFVLIPFGGAGPMHAADLSRSLGVRQVVVPPTPGVLSAVGALVSDVTCVFSKSCLQRVDLTGVEDLNAMFAGLAGQAQDWLDAEKIPASKRELLCTADFRYVGQASEVTVGCPSVFTAPQLASTVDAFHQEHERLYGFNWRDEVPVEIVAVRTTGIGVIHKASGLDWGFDGGGALDEARTDRRSVFFDGEWIDTPCYQRNLLGPDAQFDGPAIVQQQDCTTVINPGQTVTVDRFLNLVVKEQR